MTQAAELQAWVLARRGCAEIAAHLAAVRILSGLTEYELAELMGFPPWQFGPVLLAMESGQAVIPWSMIRRYELAFGFTFAGIERTSPFGGPGNLAHRRAPIERKAPSHLPSNRGSHVAPPPVNTSMLNPQH